MISVKCMEASAGGPARVAVVRLPCWIHKIPQKQWLEAVSYLVQRLSQ